MCVFCDIVDRKIDVEELPADVLNHLMKMSHKLVVALKKIYQPNGYSIMQNGGAI